MLLLLLPLLVAFGLLDGLRISKGKAYSPYCIVDEEFEIGVVGCSAPIRDAAGRIVAAVNIGAPKARLGAKLEQAAQISRKIAREVSQALYSPH